MLNEIKSVIERIYINKDHSFFIRESQKKLDFMDELLKILLNQYENVHLSDDSNNPSQEIYFELKDFSKGEFKVQYSSILSISKICNVFNLQHEFAVENIDTSKMTPVLDGFGDQAYSRQQYDLDIIITGFLQDQNFEKLTYSEMTEVISTVDMPKDSVFGSQMTVENAIFKDLWNICS